MDPVRSLEIELLTSSLYYKIRSLPSRKYVSPAALRRLYRQYCKWRDETNRLGTKELGQRFHAINVYLVHHLLERCFWIRYGDSEMVSSLLRMLFEVDGHLGYIFNYQLLDIASKKKDNEYESVCDSYTFKSTWKKEELAKETFKPLDFFIEHAYKKKQLFNGKRLAELCTAQAIRCMQKKESDILFLPPCSYAFKVPELLSQLLQYGLFVNAEPDDEDIGKLLTGVLGVLASTNGKDQSSIQSVLSMGGTLLRAVRSVDPSVLLKSQKIGLSRRKQAVALVLDELDAYTSLPALWRRCSGPQELQHLCRCQIRRSLHDSWGLPRGISLLPLPTRIKKYLNLQLD